MSDLSYFSLPPAEQVRVPRIGDLAPDFSARTTHGPVTLSDLRGQWVLLVSHPADFTPVCTSEFIALAEKAEEFRKLDCILMGLSVDGLPSHLAWVAAIKAAFGVNVPFPVLEDPSMAVAAAYGMLDVSADTSATIRAVYIIDPDGVIQAITWYPVTVGRSVDELLRLVRALRRVRKGDVLTPEGWQPGDDVLSPADLTQEAVSLSGPDWFCKLVKDVEA